MSRLVYQLHANLFELRSVTSALDGLEYKAQLCKVLAQNPSKVFNLNSVAGENDAQKDDGPDGVRARSPALSRPKKTRLAELATKNLLVLQTPNTSLGSRL